MIKKLREDKTLQGYVLSAFFALLLTMHLFSSDTVIAGKTFATPKEEQPSHAVVVPKVKVLTVKSELISKSLLLYGRTTANRQLTVKSELVSSVEALVAKEGASVKKGDVLIQLDKQNIAEQLGHVKALVNQRALEYDATKKLEKKGFQSRVHLAEKASMLKDARAQLKQLELNIADIAIKTPFDGVINKTLVEEGDYVGVGDPVAEVLDLNPIVINIFIPETNIQDVEQGQAAAVTFLNGDKKQGVIRYIAKQSDQGTNTFLAEVVVENDDSSIPAGITAKVDLTTKKLQATPISPAYLGLNDEGQSGIYIVESGHAVFKPASILASTATRLWVSSVGEKAEVIIAGHQSVIDGAEVNIVNAEQKVIR